LIGLEINPLLLLLLLLLLLAAAVMVVTTGLERGTEVDDAEDGTDFESK
jgi:hypothetical protein